MTDEQPIEPEAAETPAAPAPEERIAALEAELAKAKEDMLRALADAENTRRRAMREAADARVYAVDRFASDLLPVADALTRALETSTVQSEDALRNLLEGVALTERALMDTFARHNLKRVGERGEKFDTKIHEAVAQIPSDAPAQHVAEVVQYGYMLGDRTLRAAKVVLSLGQAATQPQDGVDVKI